MRESRMQRLFGRTRQNTSHSENPMGKEHAKDGNMLQCFFQLQVM